MVKQELKRKLHDNRNDLIGEHKFGDAGQLILFLLFFGIWFIDCFLYELSPKYLLYISIYIRLFFAIIIFVFAAYLAKASSKIIFDEVRDKPQLINTGVYKYFRHPMYLAAVLLYLSFLIFKFSSAAFIVWIFIFIFYHFIAGYEEKLLVEHLGQEYEQYRKAVSMWFPKFRKIK